MACQAEEEKRQEDLEDKVCRYIQRMKKSELQRALLQLLFDGPEWQYDRFIREDAYSRLILSSISPIAHNVSMRFTSIGSARSNSTPYQVACGSVRVT